MRIAITGTHSTGKTTLAHSISDTYGIPYVRGDKAIDIVTENFPNKPINQLTTDDQWLLQQKMLESFDEALGLEHCVTDGFHLTCLPYGIKYTGGKITQMKGYAEFMQKVIDKANQFDKILYLPPEIALENDNFRPQDQVLRMDIDREIFSLLQDFDYRTLSGTVKARTRTAGQEINRADPIWRNYIVFEGLPRSGKTTQINFLKKRAEQLGIPLYVCERNNNEYMRAFKERRKTNWFDNSREMLKLHAEAIKSDYKTNNIEERLNDGQIVVSDRQKFTTMTLFGSLGVPRHLVYEAVYDLPDAGRTFYLDTNPAMSVFRSIQTEPDRVLKVNLEIQEKCRALYLGYAKDHRFEVIPANTPAKNVSAYLEQRIFGNKIRGEIDDKELCLCTNN